MNSPHQSAAYAPSKPHYVILDGLRGVAALVVLCYHLFEAIAFAAGSPEQNLYNGFLGVDFFFILSGFVMGYAYDERWDRMSVGNFIKRRLIRLHPMVVMGVILGVMAFVMQGCVKWDGTAVSCQMLLLGTLLALFLLPVPASADVRGNTEIFPLNGPHWSLFFEYLGSLAYALLLRKLSTKCLAWWVALTAVLLGANALWGPEATLGQGWSSQPANMLGGALRLFYAYPMGLLLSRLFRNRQHTPLRLPVFGLCALALVACMVVPSMGNPVLNTLYQLFCVFLVFPAVVWIAAKGTATGWRLSAASWLGRLSYPLYAVHYPLIYLYIHWINTGQQPFGTHPLSTPLSVAAIALVLAFVCLRAYDEPLRKYLSRKWLDK